MSRKNPVLESVRTSVRRNPASVAIMVLCITGSVISALIPPLILERCINSILRNKSISLSMAILYLAMIVASDLLESAQNTSIMVFGQKLTHGLRSELCRKLNRLESGYFTSNDSGRIASVFVNDADAIDSLYSNGIVSMIADFFKITSILAIIAAKSPGLGLVLLCVTPFLFWMTRVFQKNTLRAQKDTRTAIAKMNNHIPETIRNIRMVHVLCKEGYMEDKYDDYIMENYNAVNRTNVYDSIYSPIILVTQALVVSIMMVGASRGEAMRQLFGLSVGSAVAVIAYVGKIFAPLEAIGMEIQNIQSAVAGIKNINAFLSEEERPASVAPVKVYGSDRTISFSEVTFGYDPARPVVEDFGFEVGSGDRVTFMGRTGAGKSTVFRLLTGLYRPQKGRVSLCGMDPADVVAQDRRRLYGLVEQKFTVVPGTIRDQITLYDSTITDEMVNGALETVRLDDVVCSMEKGLDTPMREGLFSQGQLQLLAIARAVVTSPEILLLDEMTANLDSSTEAKVLAALEKASEKRTVLSISHRYSDSMKDAKVIMVGRE